MATHNGVTVPYPLLIKKTKNNGTSTAVINTAVTYDMVVSEVPFKFCGDVKEPYSNDWKDEDGTEEYLPDEGLKLQGYEMDVTFLYVGTYDSFKGKLRTFLTYLLGKDNNGSRLTIYDTYTNVGRQDVRVKKIDPDVFIKQPTSGGGQEIARFKITFYVGDPMTDITLTIDNS